MWLKSVLYQVVGALKMISNFVGQMNPEWITAMATSLTAKNAQIQANFDF